MIGFLHSQRLLINNNNLLHFLYYDKMAADVGKNN